MEEELQLKWDGYLDWKGKPAVRDRHGGFLAASFVLVVEILENLAFLANASNLVTYLLHYMHLAPSKSANTVTNFMGTSFLLSLVGGLLADAFFQAYFVFLASAAIEFLGLALLTVQARSSSLRPSSCIPNSHCPTVHGAQAVFLYLGLYLVALGVGGIKGSLPTYGAEQFDDSTASQRKKRSTFFNYFIFCMTCGGLIAVTFVVWIEDNKGWQWGFGISTIAILLSFPIFLAGSCKFRNKIPTGSPLTTILKVFLSAAINSITSASNQKVDEAPETNKGEKQADASSKRRFLDRAVMNKSGVTGFDCTVKQVEETRTVIMMVPIFACTIMLNCCLAQLYTFSVQQATTMNTKIESFKVPPASLPIFPVILILIAAPVYDHIITPIARRITKFEMGVTHFQRIGLGLILSIIAMATAALVEVKRKNVTKQSGLLDSTEPLPITFLWIAFQYLIMGAADLFTLAGLLEFFFTEAPETIKSLVTSLTWVSMALGYYLSSVIVSVINKVSGNSNRKPWLAGSNINHYHLERFYGLLCILSVLNYVHYLFWAYKYKYRAAKPNLAT